MEASTSPSRCLNLTMLIPAPPAAAQQSPAAGEERNGSQKSNGAAAAASPATGASASAFLGSMLFTRCVSGTRVVRRGQHKSVGGVDFTGYGASVADYPHDYLTAACALGLSAAELDEFLLRFDKTLRRAKGEQAEAAAEPMVAAAPQDAGGVEGVAAHTANGSASVEASDDVDGVAAAAEKAAPGHLARTQGVEVAGGNGGRSVAANGAAGRGASGARRGGSGVDPGLNGSPPEAFVPECVEACGDGDGQDWDGVD